MPTRLFFQFNIKRKLPKHKPNVKTLEIIVINKQRSAEMFQIISCVTNNASNYLLIEMTAARFSYKGRDLREKKDVVLATNAKNTIGKNM